MVGQSPLLSALAIGPVRVDLQGGESRWWLLEGGFAQVQGGELTLLTSRATPADELAIAEAEAALAEAAARIATAGKDLAQVERDQQRALARKAMARTHG
jgi:F-type H+-transporting ATPase subunit epsilon